MLARTDPRCWLGAAVLAVLVLLIPCIALGQSTPASPLPQWPGPDDMARALKAQPLPAPERLATQPPRGIPRVAAIPPFQPIQPVPSTLGNIDIAAMARQGAALTKPQAVDNAASALRIFITLDMPRGSLQRLVDQATRSGATLVLRGLKKQSMRQTLAEVGELIETRRVSWVIDPDAFTRFHVSHAPTFVLALTDQPMQGTPGIQAVSDLPRCSGGGSGSGCTSPALDASYLSISGDVSLDYALDVMARRNPEAAPRASAILQRLRKP